MGWFSNIVDSVQELKAKNEADAKAGNAWYDKVAASVGSAADSVQEQAGLYVDRAKQAYVEAPNIIDYMSEESRLARAAEERKLNYFQVDAGKQAMTDQTLEVLPIAGALSKGMVIAKAGLGNRSIHDVSKLYGENISKGVKLPVSTEQIQQAALARQLAQGRTRQQFIQDGVDNRATIQEVRDYKFNSDRIKAGLGEQKDYMRNVIAQAEDPAKVAAQRKYWEDGMRQQKIDMMEVING